MLSFYILQEKEKIYPLIIFLFSTYLQNFSIILRGRKD